MVNRSKLAPWSHVDHMDSKMFERKDLWNIYENERAGEYDAILN